MSPVKYEQGFYIPEDDILHSHRRENLKSYMDPPSFAARFSGPKTIVMFAGKIMNYVKRLRL
jgi:hypothetical protein